MVIITVDSRKGQLTNKNLTSFLNYLKVESNNDGFLILYILDDFDEPCVMNGSAYDQSEWNFRHYLKYFTINRNSNGNYTYEYSENI